MKRLIQASTLIFLLFFFLGFTYEGEMNPSEFMKWDFVPGKTGMLNEEVGTMICQNPDKTAKIQHVKIYIDDFTGILIGYVYFKNNEPYWYDLDVERNRYIRIYLTHEELRGCMKCHKNIGRHL